MVRRFLAFSHGVCLPESLLAGPSDTLLRAKLVVSVVVTFVIASLGLVTAHALFGSTQSLLMVSAITVGCIASLGLLRVSGSMALLAHWSGFLWTALSITALIIRGGLHSPIAMAIAGGPVVAVFIGGRRVGVQWVIIAIVALVAFLVLEQSGYRFEDKLPFDGRSSVSAIATILFTAVLFGAVVALDLVNAAATAERDASTAQLHQAELDRVHAESAAKLAHADRMASLGQLAAGIAHEVNNPLAYVVANLEYVQSRVGETEHELDEALNEAIEGAMRVGRIVGALKTFARQEDVKLDLVPTDLQKAATAAIELARPHTQHRAVVERQFADTPLVLGDEQKLTQVFLNLIINAAQAFDETSDAPLIKVEVREEKDDKIIAVVSDNGNGIAPQDLHRVTDPFFSTKPIGVGTGLGLSVCQGIIDRHEGELRLESEPGEGTRVYLTLNAALEAKERAQTDPPSRAALERSLSILLVDDDPLVARSLSRMLPEHDVHVVNNGREAVSQLSIQNDYDLVLCDLMMDDVSGVDLYETLELQRPAQLPKIVFITGGACTDRAQTFIASVKNPVLDKPFTRTLLINTIVDITASAESSSDVVT